MSDAYVTAIGIALQTFLYLAGAYALFIRNEAKQKLNADHLGEEVREMKEELRGLSKVITEQAVQSNRLDNMDDHLASLDKRIEDLRRGDGWVHGRRGIDGEYGNKG